MAAKPLRATPYAALQPSHSIKKSGQSICFKTGQFYLLLTYRLNSMFSPFLLKISGLSDLASSTRAIDAAGI
jgi:hypothetical protein